MNYSHSQTIPSNPACKIYGYSDDVVVIETLNQHSGQMSPFDEIPCYSHQEAIFSFDDGTEICVSYGKDSLAVWKIVVQKPGSADFCISECEDEEAELYSDVFEINANLVSMCVKSRKER